MGTADVLEQITVEVYVTRPDGEQAVAQLQLGPDARLLSPLDRGEVMGEFLEPLILWGLGDKRLRLTVGGLVVKAEERT